MKRWIHAAAEIGPRSAIAKISKAHRDLEKYSDEQIEYVKECSDAITKAISDMYVNDDDDLDTPIGPKLSEIKRDYLEGAIEDDLMTEEEFEDIYNLLDVIGLELSAPYA